MTNSFYSSEEEAQKTIDNLQKAESFSKLTAKIVAQPWERDICIECGREAW